MEDDATGVYPDGNEWVCRCGKRYPEDTELVTCDCGGLLTRVLARLKIPT